MENEHVYIMSQYYTQLSCTGRAWGLFETTELNEIEFPKVEFMKKNIFQNINSLCNSECLT